MLLRTTTKGSFYDKKEIFLTGADDSHRDHRHYFFNAAAEFSQGQAQGSGDRVYE